MQAGHAAAAAAEGVPVLHAAAFLLLLLPGAWVALEEGALAALPPWRLLRVTPHPPMSPASPQRCPAAALRRRRARAARGGRGAGGPERGGRARGAQVVCAGVWHNCVLCVGCWAAAAAMPAALAPFYSTGGGAAVRRALISGPTSPICAWLRRPPKPCARAQRLAARLSAQETVWCLEERVEPGGLPPRMLHVRPQRACCAGSMHVHMQQLLFL